MVLPTQAGRTSGCPKQSRARNTHNSSLDVDAALSEASQAYTDGRWLDAEAACRCVLRSQPRHAAAFHLMGRTARKLGNPDLTVALVRRAIALEPRVAEFYNTLGKALLELRRTTDAVIAF